MYKKDKIKILLFCWFHLRRKIKQIKTAESFKKKFNFQYSKLLSLIYFNFSIIMYVIVDIREVNSYMP